MRPVVQYMERQKKKNLSENSKCNPITHYSQNKLDIENDLRKLSEKPLHLLY